MNRPLTLMVLLLLLLGHTSHAADDAPGTWLILSTTDRFGAADAPGPWRYALDAQYRWFDRSGGVDQVLLRPALGYDLTPGLSAWLGYAQVRSEGSGGTHVKEHRVWQQLAWQFDGAANSRWLLRGRVEERHREGADGTGVTLRLMLRSRIPLGKRPDLRLVLALEPFIDLRDTDWGLNQGLAQLRTTLGLSFDLHRRLGFEAGYLNQHAFRENRTDLANHLLYLHFQARF